MTASFISVEGLPNVFFCQNLTCGNTSLLPELARAFEAPVWSVGANVGLQLHFTNASGQVVGAAQWPGGQQSGQIEQSIAQISLFLTYTGNAGWRAVPPNSTGIGSSIATIDQQLSFSLCQPGLDALQALFPPQDAPGTGFGQRGFGMSGCILTYEVNGQEQGRFIFRFGALLAADDAAHRLAPSLPLAPPDEIAAVGQP